MPYRHFTTGAPKQVTPFFEAGSLEARPICRLFGMMKKGRFTPTPALVDGEGAKRLSHRQSISAKDKETRNEGAGQVAALRPRPRETTHRTCKCREAHGGARAASDAGFRRKTSRPPKSRSGSRPTPYNYRNSPCALPDSSTTPSGCSSVPASPSRPGSRRAAPSLPSRR